MTASAEFLTDAGTVQGRVPDFFIVGHHKSGTTALYEMLSRHPQIYMSDIKEPRFLASDMRARFPAARGHALPQTLEEYLSLFAGAAPQQRVGEATPSYLFSCTAAARIRELRPDARLIAILREPASFLRSLHLQLLRSHVESEKDLRKAISLEAARREGKRVPPRSHLPQLLQYSQHVRYVEQLRRYHALFAPEQLLVLIHDDFLADNQGTLRRTLAFLDVDPDFQIEELRVKETTRTMRSQKLDDLMWAMMFGKSPVTRVAKATGKALAPRKLRLQTLQTIRRVGVLGPAPAPDQALMRELRVRFKPEVVALSEYLGRDLVAQWGYEDLN
jgi:hypothetical protein